MTEESGASTSIPALDGFPLAADVFAGAPAERPVTVIVNSAMGVPRRYYAPFARHLAAAGMRVVTYDYRGIGGSAPRRLRGFAARARDWGQLDFAGVLAWVRGTQPASETVVVGHSIGGQLLGLAPGAEQIRRAVLVAAQAGTWHHWPGPSRLGVAALWFAGIPLLTSLTGQLPMGWFGLGQNVPAGVAREWAAWGRSPEYLFDPRHGLDISGYQRLAIPLRVYTFADDGYAPPRAVAALLRHYSTARIDHRHRDRVQVAARPVGHFGFFRSGVVPELWRETVDWLLGTLPSMCV
jgi:predicted alpha/beta hydrolase